jgi:hypothetical protein
MALVLICMIGGHAFGGRMGWLYRYEDYLVLGTLMIVAYLFQTQIHDLLAGKDRSVWKRAAVVALIAACFPYVSNTIFTPVAANNVFEQQYQMARFVRDYWRAPVAVNDLGLVCFRNPDYVLDLGGLASERARAMMGSNAGADAYRDLVNGASIRLVIVYDEWFQGRIPKSWRKVASMDLSRRSISSAEPQVQFYAADSSAIPVLRTELEAFRKTLPPEVKLTLHDNASPVQAP